MLALALASIQNPTNHESMKQLRGIASVFRKTEEKPSTMANGMLVVMKTIMFLFCANYYFCFVVDGLSLLL